MRNLLMCVIPALLASAGCDIRIRILDPEDSGITTDSPLSTTRDTSSSPATAVPDTLSTADTTSVVAGDSTTTPDTTVVVVVDPTTADPTSVVVDPTTADPTSVVVDPTTADPTSVVVDPTSVVEDPSSENTDWDDTTVTPPPQSETTASQTSTEEPPPPSCVNPFVDNPLNTDWWTAKSADEAGTHHIPEGSGILDLRAEHITPYGGWFTFASTRTSEWDDDLLLCWSTSETGLETKELAVSAFADGRCVQSRTYAREGVDIFPIVLIDLEPNTTYYVRAGYESWDGIETLSNVVSFTTKPDPLAGFTFDSAHPRVFLTQTQLDDLKAKYLAGDERIQYWLDLSEARTRRAMDPNGDLSGPGAYSTLAGIFGHLTEDPTYIDGGKYLVEHVLLQDYEVNLPTSNQYRWATPHLATATDLFWNHLGQPLRQRILDAIITVDELPANSNPLFTDTDEYAAFIQIQIAHGLTFLGSPDLDPDSLARLEVIFDRAIRRWYGVMQVKMRRGDKVWGLSGGTMDDGIAYAHGTQGYWLETLLMLENAGLSQAEYAPWIWNHARGQSIYGMVPDMSGLVTYGDIEEHLSNGTLPLAYGSWSADAINVCLLERYCMNDAAAYVKDALLKSRTPDESGGPHHWSLLCDNSDLEQKDLSELPTTFRANGYGLVFDRTGWGSDDSFFFFGAGWRAVDHIHDDAGHFSLWSNGAFVTHEIPSYDMENAAKHNVLILSDSPNQVNLHSAGISKILDVKSNNNYLYILADLTSAYNEDFASKLVRVVHDEVTRTVVWNKITDEVLVYDRVVGGPTPDETGYQNFLGSPAVSTLYNDRVGNRLEILSIVNGNSYLLDTATEFIVPGFGTFDRSNGQIVE